MHQRKSYLHSASASAFASYLIIFYALVISKIIFNEILVILEEQFIVNRTDYEVEQRNRKNKRQYILKLKRKKISVKLNWVEESLY